eukprot:1459539-Alexandrium_andersonii.AAC.1
MDCASAVVVRISWKAGRVKRSMIEHWGLRGVQACGLCLLCGRACVRAGSPFCLSAEGNCP